MTLCLFHHRLAFERALILDPLCTGAMTGLAILELNSKKVNTNYMLYIVNTKHCFKSHYCASQHVLTHVHVDDWWQRQSLHGILIVEKLTQGTQLMDTIRQHT